MKAVTQLLLAAFKKAQANPFRGYVPVQRGARAQARAWGYPNVAAMKRAIAEKHAKEDLPDAAVA